MSTHETHRLVEILVGIPLVAFCCYQIYTGQVYGSWRTYYRDETPLMYWSSILAQLAIAGAFLFGFTAWRD